MSRELSVQERIAGVVVCFLTTVGIYAYVKFSDLDSIWPLTWLVIMYDLMFEFLFYVGVPALVVLILYWCVKEIAEYRVDYLRDQIRGGFDHIKWKISENDKYATKEIKGLKEEVQNLRRELTKIKEEQELKNAPVAEIQEQTLQNFL